MVMNLYGRSKSGTSTSSPRRTGLGSAARGTPPSTGKKSSSKSESDAVDVSSSAPLPSLSDKHRNKSSCPCNQSLGCWKIDCSKCGQLWHVDCVGLKGLDDKIINSIPRIYAPSVLSLLSPPLKLQ